jgi:HPt (histidine-containing phosphotransfer) domain-containing protein
LCYNTSLQRFFAALRHRFSHDSQNCHFNPQTPTNATNSEKRDLAQLSSLGHFLKGSSATLGMTKVKDSCEKIQHFGAHKSADGSKDIPDDDECLDLLKKTIKQAKVEFAEVEKRRRRWPAKSVATSPLAQEDFDVFCSCFVFYVLQRCA